MASLAGIPYGQQASAPAVAVGRPAQTQPASAPLPLSAADAGPDKARQQINDQMADLAAMAIALKAEVDKSSKDELSVAVVRKAGEIEVLAHKVREEIPAAIASKK